MDQPKDSWIAFMPDPDIWRTRPLKWPEAVDQAMYWYAGVLSDDDDDGPGTDSLMLLFVDNRSGLSIEADEDGFILLRYDRDTGEVFGMEIDAFESHFLKKHLELAEGWAALKPEGRKGFHRTPWLTDEAALDYARRLKDLAYQETLAPGWPFAEDVESLRAKIAALRQPLPPLSVGDGGDAGGG